jgi:signal transduction histidine kinase
MGSAGEPLRLPVSEVPVIQPMPTDRLEELQRFAEIGWLSAHLLHEISNPLTAALLHLEQYETATPLNVRSAKRSMQQLHRYVEAARQQIRNASSVRHFHIHSQLIQVKRVLAPIARKSQVKLEFVITDNCKLMGDPVRFQQLLANIITNAIQSYGADTNGPRVVRISVKQVRGHACIVIQDWGRGMDQHELAHMFEPFYTTRARSGYGLGIGLSIVRQAVETSFGGSLRVRSALGKGTRFGIFLPLSPKPLTRRAKLPIRETHSMF